jgi:hypothetical protein
LSYKNAQKRWLVRALVLSLGAVGTAVAFAATFSADAVKAAFLFRFASYVQWPETGGAQAPFVIGVAGGGAVVAQLELIAPRTTVRGRPTEIRRVADADELAGLHILYVDHDSLKRTRALRRAALERPILLVTDSPGGLEAGGVINFLELDRNVRFEISLIAADRAQLKIDSALLSVAARVERRPQPAVAGGDGE